MTDRLIDPMQGPRAYAAKLAGVVDARDRQREQVGTARYDDSPVVAGFPIGWLSPNQATNQDVTTTTDTLIVGSDFEVSFEGARESTWLVNLTYRVVVVSSLAADTDVYARILIDWGDGTFREPDIDVDQIHGRVTAFGPVDYAESAATGTAFSLKPTAVLHVRGGSTIRVALGVSVGTGQTATISATTSRLSPHCSGTAVPHRRVR